MVLTLGTVLMFLALIFFLCGTFSVTFSPRWTPNWVALGLAMWVIALLFGAMPLRG